MFRIQSTDLQKLSILRGQRMEYTSTSDFNSKKVLSMILLIASTKILKRKCKT